MADAITLSRTNPCYQNTVFLNHSNINYYDNLVHCWLNPSFRSNWRIHFTYMWLCTRLKEACYDRMGYGGNRGDSFILSIFISNNCFYYYSLILREDFPPIFIHMKQDYKIAGINEWTVCHTIELSKDMVNRVMDSESYIDYMKKKLAHKIADTLISDGLIEFNESENIMTGGKRIEASIRILLSDARIAKLKEDNPSRFNDYEF